MSGAGNTRGGERAGGSWWFRQAGGDLAPTAALSGVQRADICIVGGGYAGLWTALRIKEMQPGADVVLVEADLCGSGASGRNGGFALTYWHHFMSLQALVGTVEAVRLACASEGAVHEIGTFCEQHDIDAQYRRQGWLWAATNEMQRGAWSRTVAAIEAAGHHPFVSMGRDGAAKLSGSSRHVDGVFEAVAATLQPAALALGLRRVAIEQGVRVFEQSPMRSLGRGRNLTVGTPGGTIHAHKVILTMNAWSGQIRELRNAIAPVASDIVLSEPAPNVLESIGWDTGLAVSDSRLMVHYYRTTHDGRVAFGKGGCALGFGTGSRVVVPMTPARTQLVGRRLHQLYPALAGVPIAAAWSGAIDRPVDGLPFYTALGRPDLICGAGFSGNGVGPTVLAGRILASMALERQDEWAACGLVRKPPGGLPPEPMRWLGGQVVRSAVRRKEDAEDLGRRPSRLAVRIAGLAPAGLVPLD